LSSKSVSQACVRSGRVVINLFCIRCSRAIVKFAPLSGHAIGATLTAMSAVGRRTIVSAPLTSPCSHVLLERRDGSPSGGLTALPALSLRTEGAKALAPPPCTGEARGGNSPSLVVIVADEGIRLQGCHLHIPKLTKDSSSRKRD